MLCIFLHPEICYRLPSLRFISKQEASPCTEMCNSLPTWRVRTLDPATDVRPEVVRLVDSADALLAPDEGLFWTCGSVMGGRPVRAATLSFQPNSSATTE